MPELPEVQTIVNDLVDAGLVGRRIRAVVVRWPGVIDGVSAAAFRRRVVGNRIQAIHRRAKFIVWRLEDASHVLMHLRMTGRLHFARPGSRYAKHEHIAFRLDDGRQLRFQDTRKFGRFYLPADPGAVLARLGPEPLDPGFSARRLAQRFQGRRRMLKPLLLDQHFIAGLGNIYVDEALWDAGLHPLRTADTLQFDDIRRLHRAIRKALRKGLKNMGTTLGTGETTFYSLARNRGRNRDALNVFRRTGAPCPRCRRPVERLVVGQRSTHICPACQPPP
ncbi:MAG: bifunctional DNA-formamidopyrimidine glycosylase/DNA-(apurinic or apyrimidinic site) lyase [Desulfobacterales bacterium]|nr:bifunctional DNA-formamidopyrimidine glycosylase/DNA-(apurinic or apyrimidinic site) lyase [Desulfobacterales bacterium]MDJ0854375.1 bifunctional DNA-formamidopyrimidine glycosylase/DNA-(apurinic or apyrimidinic site) lyase [Desulfobacterales bacterium]MDJ0887367.1 bifunctional DNA-formamidopyrimidine glycosylase/DNA-(apurinic or apyrimidinic site) lyase [Desulfobacterales bacterium]